MTYPCEELLVAVDSRALALGQRPALPLSADQVAAAESQLGFPLPALLCAVYTRVGNGGFGPGRGLMPLLEPCQEGLSRNAVEMYQLAKRPMEGFPDMVWPVGMLAFCWWGDNVFTYIDCIATDSPVYRLEPPADWGWDIQGHHLRPLGVTLVQWLTLWSEGQDVTHA